MGKYKSIKQACPCGSGQRFTQCCAAYLSGERLAPSAETLMRSRYCAYVQHNEDYILATWHPSTRPQSAPTDSGPACKWTGLEIISSNHDHVEFIARYKIQGKAYRLHEKSRFVCEKGQWFYVDGEIKSS